MCGRFTHMMSWAELVRLYQLSFEFNEPRNTQPRYNICPTDPVLFCRLDKGGNRVVDEGMWWLVPYWAKERPKYPMINARREEVATKSSWKDAFAEKRCLIPADGYYEWTVGPDKGRDPWFIHMPEKAPFSFAGIYARNRNVDGGVMSCAIITAPAVSPVDQVHDRMPVVLPQSEYDAWLDPATDVKTALALLDREINYEMTFYRVDRQVNSNKWQGGAEAIAPVAA